MSIYGTNETFVERRRESRDKDGFEPTLELRRYDDSPKLTNTRLQQLWRRPLDHLGVAYEYVWRDVPLAWDANAEYRRQAEIEDARRRALPFIGD